MAMRHAGEQVALAVDPDFGVVVDRRLEVEARAGYVDAVDLLRQRDRRAPPGHANALRQHIAEVVAHRPLRVVVLGQAAGAAFDLGGPALVSLAGDEAYGAAPRGSELCF